LQTRQGVQTGSPEEISFDAGWITAEQLREMAQLYHKSVYGQYLFSLLDQ